MDTDPIGVRLGEFEELARQLSRAAPALEDLSKRLGQELHRAGVATTPAQRIHHIATWADSVTRDLRRRVQLAHAMDRERFVFPRCTPSGTYLPLPDRLPDQQAAFDGATVARMLTSGDLSSVGRYTGISNPYFNTALLTALGPDGVITTPAGLAHLLSRDRATSSPRLAKDTQAVQAALKILTAALATAPEDFLAQLPALGRARHQGPDFSYFGYQSLALVIPRSAAFFSVVAPDLIAFDQSRVHLKDTIPRPFSLFATPRPLPTRDLFHLYSLPGGSPDLLVPLLNALPSQQSARDLLTGSLDYLLARRLAWPDHGAALGSALNLAQSDPLTLHAAELIAAQSRLDFTTKADGDLSVGPDADALSALRPHLASELSRLIPKLNSIFDTAAAGGRAAGPLDAVELDYLLLWVARDGKAFEQLLDSQIAFARVAIDRADPDHIKDVTSNIAAVLGHLLEARNQAIHAEDRRVSTVNKELQDRIAAGIGLIPIPYGERIGNAAGPLAADAFNEGAHAALAQIGKWIYNEAKSRPLAATATPTTNSESVQTLLSQMIASSLLTRGAYDPTDLKGQSFITGDPPKILPLSSMSDMQYEELTQWITGRSHIRSEQNIAGLTFEHGARTAAGHLTSGDNSATPTKQG